MVQWFFDCLFFAVLIIDDISHSIRIASHCIQCSPPKKKRMNKIYEKQGSDQFGKYRTNVKQFPGDPQRHKIQKCVVMWKWNLLIGFVTMELLFIAFAFAFSCWIFFSISCDLFHCVWCALFIITQYTIHRIMYLSSISHLPCSLLFVLIVSLICWMMQSFVQIYSHRRVIGIYNAIVSSHRSRYRTNITNR